MENNKKNEFDDIILEKSNKNEKIKKILLRAIALIILFLVVMIVMKLINSDESTEQLTPPSEPITQVSTESNNGFENMPITENSPEDQFDLLRKQLQGEESNESSQIQAEPSVNSETQTPPPAIQEPAEVEEQTPVAKQEPSPIKQNTPKPKQEAPKKTEAPKVNTPKESPKKEADPKDLFKNVEAIPTHSSGLAMGMYVQIFSVSNLDQKSKELANVKAKGYDYKLFKTTINGKEITKVLIGPFEKDKIANELAKIRQEIAKDAFSFTLK
ncbi:SPOR domain-containing protein [Campylobacter vulpis]|uniref:Membrane protein n=1 Tax=Campylobacter vulpis TaxID=1655500 RepID=A0A2G4R0J8_9BACT|nr:SPOR domain-containing protein [Campylobacter vulpis]MBS4235416.1 SPOR domain-containing protein [Campylobacter vulpis]MBS4241161.1 SPOR domain-containing protein [Campylobacter vulpis]MBS4252425.1 SPOR domain-containing protein [Campylobacter vulpis]MBS4269286.1 SPOR domain-containing protein [Campylobacter vulpis]MBS4281702.1 SPOR domain-containing protein [Campylobacter vulpis]